MRGHKVVMGLEGCELLEKSWETVLGSTGGSWFWVSRALRRRMCCSVFSRTSQAPPVLLIIRRQQNPTEHGDHDGALPVVQAGDDSDRASEVSSSLCS